MNRLLLLTLSIFSTTALWAQQSTISARLSDATTDEGVIGAVVELTPLQAGGEEKFTTSGYDGALTLSGVKYGTYIIKAAFLGYEDYIDTLKVATPRLVLGSLKIKESATAIDAVVKEVQAMRTSQQGDTLSYNASAFKVAADADVEGLLKKMPGITISSDGEVSAQGETIQKVYVDGREFFGNDVTTAISSLPAEIVESINVYDKLSDNAELSGMDDGEGYKSINIVTKPNMRQGFFGKMYAGYGYQPEVQEGIDHNKYTVGANINYFKNQHRLSLITMFNNINKQNFSFDDILGVSTDGGSASNYMVRPQSGVAEVGAIGLNYSSAFGADDKVEVEASYFYNGTQTRNNQSITRWYEEPSPDNTLETEGNSYTPNYNHRLNTRVEWKITPTQQITFRQNGSVQINNPESSTFGSQYGESGYKITDSYSLGEKRGYNTNSSLSYISRLGKVGRSISANANFTLRSSDNQTESYSNSASTFYLDGYDYMSAADTVGLYDLYKDELIDLYYRSVFSPTTSQYLSGNVSYSEPLSENLRFTVKYVISSSYQQTARDSYITGSDFATEGLSIDPATSNSREVEYLKHQIGPGLYYVKGKSKFSLSGSYQLSEMTGKAVVKGSTEEQPLTDRYKDFVYAAMGHLYFNTETSLRMHISSSTSNPWVGYLVDTYDISNKQYITKGNPNLQPTYKQSLRMHFVRSNIEKGSTFMFMAMAENTADYVAKHIVYSPNAFEIDGTTYEPMQYTTYVNLDNYWKLRSRINYGFPLPFIKCNLNLSGGVDYTLTPSMYGGTVENDGTIVGGAVNHTESLAYNAGTVLGSNISENVDFTLSWEGTYNEATNSASTTDDINKYFSHTASATMKFVFGAGFTFTASTSYKQYKGITNTYEDSYLLCNAFIGKQIFRNRRGELNLGVNDILDQNTAFYRSVNTGYTQNTINSVIGRYVTLQFVYNLRSFGSGESKKSSGFGPGSGRPPMRSSHMY